MHPLLLQNKIEKEKQLYIDSAKFVERMNKQRKERDMRLLQQRQKLVQKMELMHERIVHEIEVKKAKEEEDKNLDRQKVYERLMQNKERINRLEEQNMYSNKVI